MGVHIIVDGYNLIRSSADLSRQEAISLEDGRNALISRLSAYKRVKFWPVTVVFDAMGGPHLSEKAEHVAGIKVVYSPADKTADQVIKKLAQVKGEQAVVVTSDKDLAGAVEACGATVIDSQTFENKIEMAFYYEVKGMDPVDVKDREPTLSTRKKGPSKRRPKSERRKKARLSKI